MNEPRLARAGDRGVLVELGAVSLDDLHAAAAAVRSVAHSRAWIIGHSSLLGRFETTATTYESFASAVREALRKSGATMYVVSRTGASKAAPTFAGVNSMTAEAARRQMDDSELADTALQLNLVLGDGSRDSGGYQQETALTSAVPTLQQLASEITHQYEITYSLTEGGKPLDKLQLTTRRKNVTLRAPSKIPN